MSGRIQDEVKLLTSVKGRKLHGPKITLNTVTPTGVLAFKLIARILIQIHIIMF